MNEPKLPGFTAYFSVEAVARCTVAVEAIR